MKKKTIKISLIILAILVCFGAGYLFSSNFFKPEKNLPNKDAVIAEPIKTPDYGTVEEDNQAIQLNPKQVKNIFGTPTYGFIDKVTEDPQYNVAGNTIYHVFYTNKTQAAKIKSGESPEANSKIRITTFTVYNVSMTYITDNFQLLDKTTIPPNLRKNKYGQNIYYSRALPPTAFVVNKENTKVGIITGKNSDLVLRVAQNIRVN